MVKEKKDILNINTLDVVEEALNITAPQLKADTMNIQLISTGFPSLDLILGGGFALGRIISLSGLEGTGKSSLAQQIMGKVQKQRDDFILVYLDVEATCSQERFQKMGLDINRGFIYKQPQTIEEFWKIIEGLIEARKVLKKKTGKDFKYLVTLDTVAALQTVAMHEEERFDKEMAQRARVWSASLGKFTKALVMNDITLFFINQLRADMNANSFFGPQYDTPGGMALKFYPFQIVQITEKEVSKKENVEKGIKIVTVTTTKNKAFRPMIKIEMVFDYMNGYVEPLTELRYLQNEKFLRRVPGGGFKILDDSLIDTFKIEKLPEEKELLTDYENEGEWTKKLNEIFTFVFNRSFNKNIEDEFNIEESGMKEEEENEQEEIN